MKIAAFALLGLIGSPSLAADGPHLIFDHGRIAGMSGAGDTCAEHDDPCRSYQVTGTVTRVSGDAAAPSSFDLKAADGKTYKENFDQDQTGDASLKKFFRWFRPGRRVVVTGTQTGAMGMALVNTIRVAPQ